jgi:hypothetical protein
MPRAKGSFVGELSEDGEEMAYDAVITGVEER